MKAHVAAAALLLAVALSAPVELRAAEPVVQVDAVAPDGALAELRRSLPKALTYQSIVIATDQLLYWPIITGTAESELEFLAGNAVSGIAYYVAFDVLWHAAGLETGGDGTQVNVTKALAYRVFDTARVFGVTLAIGTPLTGSLEVAAAIAATRTVIYVMHDYLWSWATMSGGVQSP